MKIVQTCLFFLFVSAAVLAKAEDVVIYDPATTKPDQLRAQSSNISVTDSRLEIKGNAEGDWPGVSMRGEWNLEKCDRILIEVENTAKEELNLCFRIDSEGADAGGTRLSVTNTLKLAPGEKKSWECPLPASISAALKDKLFAMRGFPGGGKTNDQGAVSSGPDRTKLRQWILFIGKTGKEHSWKLGRIVGMEGESENPVDLGPLSLPPEKFFPMIDKFGQYVHKDWPGKIKDLDDLKSRTKIEVDDISKHPSPEKWNKYGGWLGGPEFEATGSFRTIKHEGKWWLVDPEGRLFWSHGVDCVGDGNGTTPITDREFYFADLPQNSPFYGSGNWAPHNYYEGRGQYRTFNFTASNASMKYGEDWRNIYAETAHKRLRSWGMNTIANWSSSQIYGLKKTPYTATLGINAPPIAGSDGYWGKFPDPFHPSFARNALRSIENQKRQTGNDPWCIGYFVDNEIAWGSSTSLSMAALSSPADQPVKTEMLAWLRERYDSIEKLNEKWGTNYSDWDALLESQQRPNERRAKDDLEAFYTVIAEQYFKVLSESLKEAIPDKLYLGCRFAWVNDLAIRASAKYCDVISFNFYRYELDSFKLPSGLDRPCIVGEFHFGALDRGMFHTGLCPTKSQADRAAAYEKYVRSALRNPALVGTHWFQYGDQATTGRGDGENYQIGLVDVCDTPYPETIDALRKIGYEMYDYRSKSK